MFPDLKNVLRCLNIPSIKKSKLIGTSLKKVIFDEGGMEGSCSDSYGFLHLVKIGRSLPRSENVTLF